MPWGRVRVGRNTEVLEISYSQKHTVSPKRL
jgi:hypothetical protein